MMENATRAERAAFAREWREIQRWAAAIVKANGHDIKIVREGEGKIWV